MKIRSGFVSNSSSASFVLKFKSTYDKGTVSEHLSHIYDDQNWVKEKFRKNKVKPDKDGIYTMSLDTNMFNDWYDVIEWPLVRMLFDKDLINTGYELVSLTQTEEEYSDCNYPAEFENKTWEEDWYKSESLNKKDDKKIIEMTKEREKIDGEYANFLYHIGINLDDIQKLSLLNYKFSK